MITKILNTLSGKVKIKIPTDLSEITLGSMIAMQSATGDEIPLIPELTKEVIENIIEFSELLDIRERILSLAHQIKYTYQETKLPSTLMGVKIPTNLSMEPAGAYLVSRDLIATEINKHIAEFGEDNWQSNFQPSLDCCAGILSNYFYCQVTGKLWNEQLAEDFKSEVLKLSIQDALPVARYFFLSYPNMSQQKMSFYQAFKLQLKRRQALIRLRNSNISPQ